MHNTPNLKSSSAGSKTQSVKLKKHIQSVSVRAAETFHLALHLLCFLGHLVGLSVSKLHQRATFVLLILLSVLYLKTTKHTNPSDALTQCEVYK